MYFDCMSGNQGENLARDINAVFLETSAKDNICVNDLFQVNSPLDYNKFFIYSFILNTDHL